MVRHDRRIPAGRRVTLFAGMALLATPLASPAAAPSEPPLSSRQVAQAREIRDRALADDTAYETLRSLTTEVGPRFAGTEGDARAVAWALERLTALGFRNVRAEPVKVPRWVRGEARAEIVSPWPQPLVAVALGGSVAAPPAGIEAEVVAVTDTAALVLIGRERVAGRIVFFTGRMNRTRDASGYGAAVTTRSRGAVVAARLGAVAVVIRSVGTSSNRVAHTGGMRYEPGVTPIPALALSNPDADLVEHQIASGRPVRLRLTTSSHTADSTMSANVVGEIPGRGLANEIVLLAAHLDSWDLGTGAHDDGAGVAIVTSAARLAGATRPRRTLRVVLYANEEFGTSGAKAYAAEHAAELERHVIGMESDLGAFSLWGFAARVPPERLPLARALHAVFEPLGLVYLGNEAGGGADLGPLVDLGMPVLDLRTDAAPYFDLHHTANDTFDKVDPRLLRENVAAYAMAAYLAAEAEGGFGRLPPKKK